MDTIIFVVIFLSFVLAMVSLVSFIEWDNKNRAETYYPWIYFMILEVAYILALLAVVWLVN